MAEPSKTSSFDRPAPVTSSSLPIGGGERKEGKEKEKGKGSTLPAGRRLFLALTSQPFIALDNRTKRKRREGEPMRSGRKEKQKKKKEKKNWGAV